MAVTVDSSNTQLPDDDVGKSDTYRYFAATARDKPSDVQIREIASILGRRVVTHSYYYGTDLEIGYTVGFCEVTATGTDDESCDERCRSEVLSIFKKWCGYSDSVVIQLDDKESIEAKSTNGGQDNDLIDSEPGECTTRPVISLTSSV